MIQPITKRVAFVALVLFVVLVSPSANADTVADSENDLSTTSAAQARAALKQMEAAWNAHDLEGFLQGYWADPAFRFVSGSERAAGWEETRALYHSRYGIETNMGQVTFSEVEVASQDPRNAVLLARYTLDFGGKSLMTGYATFVFQEKNGDWVVVYEHASH